MDKYDEGAYDYNDSKEFLEKMEKEGYTFEYGLDNEPYGLRKLSKDDEDYEMGWKMKKGGKTKQSKK